MKTACDFCEKRCRLDEGQGGLCGARECQGGRIVTHHYGDILRPALDPIEKKPFYHFLPGEHALSLAMLGCNFTCRFCQNFAISQKEYFSQIQTIHIEPEDVPLLMDGKRTRNTAYTYSEPTVWQDFMIDCAREVRRHGGFNLMVTNGFFTEQALERLIPWIDGFNIDLKGGDEFYREICGGRQEPVLRNIRSIASLVDKVLEVTTLYIPSLHRESEIFELGDLLGDAGVQVWHLNLFYPAYKMEDFPAAEEPQAVELFSRLRQKVSIPFLYLGNTSRPEAMETHCPSCGQALIRRTEHYRVEVSMGSSACPDCGAPIYGKFLF